MSAAVAELLRVEGLTKVFGAGHTEVVAVGGVDLTTDRGEITLVMGPSGSGKTTLLTMIGCLLRPTSGRVVIDGVDVTALPAREHPRIRRTLVGFVFQTFNLLDALTARENVEVALNIGGVKGVAAGERADRLLVDVGLGDRLDFPPTASRPASGSVSRSHGRWRTIRLSSSPTSPRRTSTHPTGAT